MPHRGRSTSRARWLPAAETRPVASSHSGQHELALLIETAQRVTLAVKRGDYTARDIMDVRALLPIAKRVDIAFDAGFTAKLESAIKLLSKLKAVDR